MMMQQSIDYNKPVQRTESTGEKKPLLLFLFLLFLLQDPLSIQFKFLDYLDEGLTVLLLGVLFFDFTIRQQMVLRLPRWMFGILLAGGGVLVLGIFGNVCFGYQSFLYAALDIVFYLKFFVGFAAGTVFYALRDNLWLSRRIVGICKIIAVIQMLLCIHEQLFDPWFTYLPGRGRLHALKLFYSNQTYFVAYSVFMLAILLYWNTKDKLNFLYCGMLMLEIASTLRSKGWGFLAALILLILFTKKIWIKNPVPFAVIGIPLAAYVARDKIALYFFTASHYSPRAVILQDSIQLANQHFPLGTGFGTFCSPGATLGGSVLYRMLGNDYSSMYIADSINDMYWGYALGQFGWIGAALIAGILVTLCFVSWKLQNQHRRAFLTSMCIMIYLVIASIAESPFFAAYIVGFSFLLGMLLAERSTVADEEDFAAE